jgi:hypothetical protein
MISSYLTMQNAILARNMATSNMMQVSKNMLSSASFGNSQPLRPAFAQYTNNELQAKSDETKISILQKIINSVQQKFGKEVKKSTPNYSGVNVLA